MKILCRIYMWLMVLTASYQRKIVIGHTLNSWEWPFKYFGKYYLSLPNFIHDKSILSKYVLHKKIFKYLNKVTTKYDQLYYHNVIKGHELHKMTPDEFEHWFHNERMF